MAALQSQIEIEDYFGKIRGSGEDPAEEQKQMLAEQEKQRKAFDKKRAEMKRQDQIKEIKTKMDKIKAKMKVKQQYESMKTLHGGLTGTEDTGYNDDDMSLFLKRPANFLQLDEQDSSLLQ